MAKRMRSSKTKAGGRAERVAQPWVDAGVDRYKVIGEIPRGKAYQWVAESIMGQPAVADWDLMRKRGWKPVPARRHPKMPRDRRGCIAFGGQVLMERDVAISEQARREEVVFARKMFAEHPASGQPVSRSATVVSAYIPPVDGGQKGFLDRLESVRKEIEEAGGAIEVTIKLALSESEVEAAATVNLSCKEYAQRKVLMIGDLNPQALTVLRETRPNVFVFDKVGILHPQESAS